MSRVALLINPDTAVLHGTFYSQALESAAASLRVEPAIANVFATADIAAAIGSLGKQPGSGLIVAPDTLSEINGDLIYRSQPSIACRRSMPISRFVLRKEAG